MQFELLSLRVIKKEAAFKWCHEANFKIEMSIFTGEKEGESNEWIQLCFWDFCCCCCSWVRLQARSVIAHAYAF